MSKLPNLQARSLDAVQRFATRALNRGANAEDTELLGVEALPDNLYRAYFRLEFFNFGEQAVNVDDPPTPSKSQWNTLQKRIKRMDKKAFTPRSYGNITHDEWGVCCYIDFGFFLA